MLQSIKLVTVVYGTVVFHKLEDTIQAEIKDIKTVGYYPEHLVDSMTEAVVQETGYDFVALDGDNLLISVKNGQNIKAKGKVLSQAIDFKILN